MVLAPRPYRIDPRPRRRRRGPAFWSAITLLFAAAGALATYAYESLRAPERRPMPSLFDEQAAVRPAGSATPPGGADPTAGQAGSTTGAKAPASADAARRSPMAGARESNLKPIAPRRLTSPASAPAAPAAGRNAGPGQAPAPAASRVPGGAAPPAAPIIGAPIVRWEEAHRHIGATVAVEGKVVEAHDTGKVCFLNFARDRRGFYVVIFREAHAGWDQPPQTLFLNKKIRVTGKVGTYEGRPQIRVRSAEQIQLVR